jgi:hypothetical protein
MRTNDIKKFLKKNQKPLLIALAVVVVLVVAWIIWRRSRGINAYQKQLAEENTGTPVTVSINWNDLASRLRKAFSGPNSSGTDESEVYAVLNTLRTQADWEYLKRYWPIYCESLPLWQRLRDNLFNTGNYKSLPVLLIYELDSRELQQCRDILAANGITPDF